MKKKLDNILVLVGLIALVLCVFALPILATCAIVFNWEGIFKFVFCILTVFEILWVISFVYSEIQED